LPVSKRRVMIKTERELRAEAKAASKARVEACVAEVRAKRAIRIFTDGACSGNPGPGGWGVMIQKKGATAELSGGDPQTTNNRMELTAAIQGLKS